MRKVICAINLTIDGYCDHTAGIVDDDLHNFYADYLDTIDVSIMGRKTYQLMEDYWPDVAKNKAGSTSEIKFAQNLEKIQKLVVSSTLKNVTWSNSKIIRDNLTEELFKLKKQSGKDISIGSVSLISYFARKQLIDEFIFVLHPIILGKGKQLFADVELNLKLELISTKVFNSGVIMTHYKMKK